MVPGRAMLTATGASSASKS